ncbi:MAG: hypothetical protein JSW26_03445 [Desulfobacterales bacterium]|nr:MAG: hypothetical protein JSW26_03445 [Desulfobacterales bacterium]
MKKTASIYTNDKSRPQQDLVISGQVENFATIRPEHVSLRGHVGDSIKEMVSIVPEKKYPFKILDAKARSGQNINIQLDEITKSNGTAYELKVENLSQKSGRYYDTIILKTDSKIRPELNVRVYGYLRERKSE